MRVVKPYIGSWPDKMNRLNRKVQHETQMQGLVLGQGNLDEVFMKGKVTAYLYHIPESTQLGPSHISAINGIFPMAHIKRD